MLSFFVSSQSNTERAGRSSLAIWFGTMHTIRCHKNVLEQQEQHMIPLATMAHRSKVVVVGVGTTDELTRPNDRVRSKPAFVCTGALASSNECPLSHCLCSVTKRQGEHDADSLMKRYDEINAAYLGIKNTSGIEDEERKGLSTFHPN